MKIPLTAAIHAALCSIPLCGCIEDQRGEKPNIAVTFSTSIPKTRAYDNKWEYGDHIGVYMLPAGSDNWNNPETAPLAANRKYGHDIKSGGAATGDVIFSGVDESNTLVWPGGDTKVDFTAYYPWREADDPDNYIYAIDLTDQNPQKEVDLMWSNNIKGQSSGSPELRFAHALTKLVFNVTDLDETSLEDMTATFVGLPTLAGFNLATGRMVDTYITDTEDTRTFTGLRSSAGSEEEEEGKAIVEAIVLPGSGFDYKVNFSLGGSGSGGSGEKAIFTPSKNGTISYEAGKRYVYNIRLQPRRGENTSFGADGELESIDDWETPEEDGGDHDVDKTTGQEPGDVTPGAKWESGTLSSSQNGYTLTTVPGQSGGDNGQNGYRISPGGTLTITKEDYQGGISSIGISLTASFSKGRIVSVKVDGTSLVTDDGSTPGSAAVDFANVSEPKTYTFRPAGGTPLVGAIEIVVEATSGNVYVIGFGVNADN